MEKKFAVQAAHGNRKVTSQALPVNLVLHIFKLVLYFNSFIISNQIKYCLAVNRGSFLQIQYGFYRYALQFHYQNLKEVNAWNETVWSIMMKAH